MGMPGKAIRPEDDPEAVPDTAMLYRRVAWDKIGGRSRCPLGEVGRLNANCFTDWPPDAAAEAGFLRPCMSVGVSTVLERLGYSPEKMLEDYPDYGLACVTAGVLRSLTKADGITPCPQGIMLAPTEKEPWHGVVFDLTSERRSGAAKSAIVAAAKWVIPLLNSLFSV
jgi:hypothetical protein